MNLSPLRVVLLVIPPVRELDLVGIVDVFATANGFLRPERQYQVELVTSSAQSNIEGMCGLQFTGARHYSKLEGEIDTLLVPGVHPEKVHLSPELLRWFRSRANKCRRVGSVCTGAFIMAEAGLLDGKRVATHWAFVKEFSSRFPAVTIDGNPIWIRDGNIYSSAGVTSGIDLSLALVEEDHGRKVALEVARMLVVFLCRPGNQAQFSVSLREQRTDHDPLRDLQVWIVENLQSDLSTPALAARVAMSERNFQRVFTREIGKSPAMWKRCDSRPFGASWKAPREASRRSPRPAASIARMSWADRFSAISRQRRRSIGPASAPAALNIFRSRRSCRKPPERSV